jgi:hypothetical protein
MVLSGIFAVVAFCQVWTLLQPISNFILLLEAYNNLGHRSILYPLHVSDTKRCRQLRRLQPHLQLCALEQNVFTDVINLDKYNLFLLGLRFQRVLYLLQHLLMFHQLTLLILSCLLDTIRTYISKWPRKPPDPKMIPYPVRSDDLVSHLGQNNGPGLIACSSGIANDFPPFGYFHRKF